MWWVRCGNFLNNLRQECNNVDKFHKNWFLFFQVSNRIKSQQTGRPKTRQEEELGFASIPQGRLGEEFPLVVKDESEQKNIAQLFACLRFRAGQEKDEKRNHFKDRSHPKQKVYFDVNDNFRKTIVFFVFKKIELFFVKRKSSTYFSKIR